MPSSRKRIADSVCVGEPPKKLLKDVETVKVTVYNFKDRKEKRNEYFESPILKAHGYNWSIRFYPRGSARSSTEKVHVSLFLYLRDQNDVSISSKATIRCKLVHYTIQRTIGSDGWGFKNFLPRDSALESHLDHDGSLIIEVDIQIAAEDKRVWYPNKLLRQDILVELYQDASSKSSDVVFSVDGTVYKAHKNILSLRCKKIYEIAMECECDNDKPISIHSVSGNIFKSILDFVYTVKTPNIEDEGIAIELLVAADRFHCVHLKLYAESIIVDRFLSAENAAELLIFADSHSCSLLKEAATNLFIADMKTVKSAEAWSKVKESNRLVVELLDSIEKEDCSDEIGCMDVSALRKELEEANLDLDGSREVLIDRLKTSDCNHLLHLAKSKFKT